MERLKLTISHTPLKAESDQIIYTRLHNVDIEMRFPHHLMRGWIEEKLALFNAPIWQNSNYASNPLRLRWVDVTQSLLINTESWCHESDHELKIHFQNEHEIATQRDFIGIVRNTEVQIYCPNEFDDSFYNALRWILPRHLILQNKLILHSSAFVSRSGSAHLFSGPSGVGKTTTVTRIIGHTILGDDMILVYSKDGKAYAETPILGQNPRFHGSAGNSFPIEAIHFLNQGKSVNCTKITAIEANKRLISSILYPTWSTCSAEELKKINQLAQLLLSTTKTDQLTLDRSSPFLHAIDSSYTKN